MNLLQKDKAYVWHPFSSLQEKYPPLLVKSAKGCKLILDDGTEVIDAVSSWWTNIHGHGNPELLNVLTKQALELDHVIFAGFTHAPAVTLSENLIKITGDNFSKVFFSDDGSTAVEVGLKLALQYWSNKGIEKSKVIAIDGAYHGDTFGAMSLAGKSEFFKAFNDKMFDVLALPFPTEENIDKVIGVFEEELKQEDVACLVLEPKLQGAAGMRMYSEELLAKLFAKAKEYGVLIVADEVLTGFGRTGDLFSSINGEIKPDIMALSKALTGGVLPLGVTLANDTVLEAFDTSDASKTFYHGHSFTANAITCALSNQSMEMLLKPEMTAARKFINESHQEVFESIKNHSRIKTVRILGTVLAMEIDNGEETSYFSGLRDTIYQKAMSKGVLLRPLGNVVYVIPPYVITKEELTKVYKTIDEILDEI